MSQSEIDDAVADTIVKEFEGTDEAKMQELFDEVITNDDLEEAAQDLGSYLYEQEDAAPPDDDAEVQDANGETKEAETESATGEPTDRDENMQDAEEPQEGGEAVSEAE